MDEPTPSSAADLGISEVEYERILRDVRQRHGIAAPSAPPAPAGVLRRPRPRRWVFSAVAGVVAMLTVLIRPGMSGQGPQYAFLQTVNGQPVTYSSCRMVQVAVYPAGGPRDAEKLVREAVDDLRSATGLNIVVTGAFGGHAPNWNFKAAPVTPDDPISVSWQDGAAIAELTDHIAGLGGSRVITGPRGIERLGAGTIALSRDYYRMLDQRGEHAKELAVLLHEFGHVFGLAHVDSRNELMYKSTTDRTTFGAGDLEGLRRLGHGPCT